ncbi:MAG: DUF2341 domain-containing protein [Candidatus Woesearchaeota archaeon]|jgi:hypothetical protein|nr:DUF2341 domain-containing protein [Candidatus Woesearchaeota archaeon]
MISRKSLIKISMVFVLMLLMINLGFSWWDGSYPLRQTINVSTPSGTAPADYSVEIILNSTIVGAGFDWSQACYNNLSKIRLVDDTDSVKLDYWIKNCSSSSEEIYLWTKIPSGITTAGYNVFMYYGNSGASYEGTNASAVFDFYFNMSGLTISSEGAGQDSSGNGDILENGRTFHTWGNSWKVLSGFTSYAIYNNGSQMLDLSFRSSDCGEIASIKFDTNTVQEDTNNYRWCGSQTNWGIVPDDPYSGSSNWEDVGSVLNDFTVTPTHIHLPIDDDADASGDIYFKDIRIRKYVANEPGFIIGGEEAVDTTLTYMNPITNYTTGNNTVEFTCSAVTTNTTELDNISIYGNFSGSWSLNQTTNLIGQINSTNFTISLPLSSGVYLWSCVAYDQSGGFDWGVNHTLIIDKTLPQINLHSPFGSVQDVTPTINVSFSETVTSWFNIDNGLNHSLCNNCLSIDTSYLHLAEGDYAINIFANDSYDNFNSSLNNSFTIDMKGNFFENFVDDSSIDSFNDALWNGENISYSGGSIKYYQGLEIGVLSSDMTYIANQWNGAANAGEVDITCIGGDANCWFVRQNGTNVSAPHIGNGVTTLDSDFSTVGFVMYSEEDIHTRFSPAPHAQQSNYFVAVCYNSGQWYYDDNNGCNEAFTPISSDVLVANLTWGIGSVSENIADRSGSSEVIFKSINTTKDITSITNITWDEYNSGSNKLEVNLSFDYGMSWYNMSNGLAFSNFTGNNSMIVKLIVSSDGLSSVSLDNLNISWISDNAQVPIINLTSPLNSTNILGNGTIELGFNITDNEYNLSCNLYLNDLLNRSFGCNNTINYYNLTLPRGNYNWIVEVLDNENNTINSSKHYFNLINEYDLRIRKEIIFENNDQYKIIQNVSSILSEIPNYNIIDFVDNSFNYGSFGTLYDWENITSGLSYNGTVLGWELNLEFNNTYSVVGVDDYYLGNYFVVGVD